MLYGGGSVVVGPLFGVLPIGCGGSVFVFVFVCICVYSSFAVIFEGKKELIAFIVLRVSCYCKCSVILPHGAVGWSALCDCGIY